MSDSAVIDRRYSTPFRTSLEIHRAYRLRLAGFPKIGVVTNYNLFSFLAKFLVGEPSARVPVFTRPERFRVRAL